MSNLPEPRCPKCGAHIELPLSYKKWVVRLYEDATGLVLLPSTARRLGTKEMMKKTSGRGPEVATGIKEGGKSNETSE